MTLGLHKAWIFFFKSVFVLWKATEAEYINDNLHLQAKHIKFYIYFYEAQREKAENEKKRALEMHRTKPKKGKNERKKESILKMNILQNYHSTVASITIPI